MTNERQRRAASFENIGAEYHRLRPGYPDDAVDWMLPAGASDVLDLGAGTGRLTDSLVARGLNVVAVDPSEQMLGVLAERHAGVRTLVGTAEATGLPDASVDAVVIGQAWHWMDAATASTELARVLRPGGALAMIWNMRADTGDWRDEFHRVQEAARGLELLEGETRPAAPFGPVEMFHTAWSREVTPDDFLRLYFTQSPWLVASEDERSERLGRWRSLLDAHGADSVVEGYTVEAWRTRLVI